jgi:hypothetical protein
MGHPKRHGAVAALVPAFSFSFAVARARLSEHPATGQYQPVNILSPLPPRYRAPLLVNREIRVRLDHERRQARIEEAANSETDWVPARILKQDAPLKRAHC